MGRKNRRKQEHIRKLSDLGVYPKRMEIWYATLPMDRRTSVQGGSRPVVIISNDICNKKSNTVTVAPITSRLKHLDMPTHVILKDSTEEPSMMLAEQIQTIDKRYLNRKIGDCKEIEDKIEKSLLIQIGIELHGSGKEEENGKNYHL